MKPILFETRNLTVKSENSTAAEHLYLRFNAGETAALLGERDSGRLSFFDYLVGRCGVISGTASGRGGTEADEYLRSRLFTVTDSEEATSGVSITENLYLVRKGGFDAFLWEPEKYEKKCCSLLAEVQLERNPSDDIGTLRKPEYLKLQIAKGLLLGAEIIALEEDFEGFTPEEIDELAMMIGKLKLERNLSLIWSTNGLRGVSELADRIIVFSGGTAVKQFLSQDELTVEEIEAIIHQDRRISFGRPEQNVREEVFRAENLELNRIPFTLSLRKGEVISVVEYNTEEKNRLFQTLIGEIRNGCLSLEGKQLPKNWPFHREKYPVIGIDTFGIKGLFANLSPAENLFLPSMRKASGPGFVLPASGYQAVWNEWKADHPGSAETIAEMSRADRLSLQLESWLIFHPKVLILLEPFLHLDQQGRDIFGKYFGMFRKRGTGIIVLSSSRTNYLGADAKDIETGLFDRIIYTEGGRVINETE